MFTFTFEVTYVVYPRCLGLLGSLTQSVWIKLRLVSHFQQSSTEAVVVGSSRRTGRSRCPSPVHGHARVVTSWAVVAHDDGLHVLSRCRGLSTNENIHIDSSSFTDLVHLSLQAPCSWTLRSRFCRCRPTPSASSAGSKAIREASSTCIITPESLLIPKPMSWFEARTGSCPRR